MPKPTLSGVFFSTYVNLFMIHVVIFCLICKKTFCKWMTELYQWWTRRGFTSFQTFFAISYLSVTNRLTDKQMNRASCWGAMAHLKRKKFEQEQVGPQRVKVLFFQKNPEEKKSIQFCEILNMIVAWWMLYSRSIRILWRNCFKHSFILPFLSILLLDYCMILAMTIFIHSFM